MFLKPFNHKLLYTAKIATKICTNPLLTHCWTLSSTRFFSSTPQLSEDPFNQKKPIVLKNYYKEKTQEPVIIHIDGVKEAKLLTPLRRRSFKTFKEDMKDKVIMAILPTDYPDSVSKEYLPFSIYQGVSGITITTMTFLSTQALFVALGS